MQFALQLRAARNRLKSMEALYAGI